ncbi:MAG: T9SS type A sorting domain-containing protein [Balneolaceae bacterium]
MMKKFTKIIFGMSLVILLGAGQAFGQRNVEWRTTAANGNWFNGDCSEIGTADSQWKYSDYGGNTSRNRPNCYDGTTENHIIIINNNHELTMNVNEFVGVNRIIFNSNATSERFINGKFIDLYFAVSNNPKIENYSTANHTINNGIAFKGNPSEINPVNGNLVFNSDIYQNGNFLDIYGSETLTINGNLQDGSGAGGVAVKSSTVNVVYSTNAKEYTGSTYIENGVLSSSVNLSTNLVQIQDGGTFNVTENISINSLEIQSGGTLNIGAGDTLTIRSGANFKNNGGTIDLNGTGAIKYEREITGVEGWRMLSSPVDGGTYSDLLGNIWTQGFPGATYDNSGDVTADPSVQTFNIGTDSFGPISNLTDNMEPGQGFITYVYSDDDYDGTPDAFPKTLSVSGTENAAPVTANINTAADGWSLVGNPFASTIVWGVDLDTTDLTGAVYVYDHSYGTPSEGDVEASNSAGSYHVWNGTAGSLTDGKIAPFQGFWVQNTADATAPALEFTEAAKSTGGTFYKQSTQSASFRMIAQMDGRANDAYFSFTNEGKIGKDNYDALKLSPLDYADYLSLGTEVNGVLMDINNLPYALKENVEFPLEINSFKKIDGGYALKGGEVTLSLADLKNIPESWGIIFNNYNTGETIDLRAQESYTFEIAAKAKMVKAKTAFSVLSPAGVTREKSMGASGFSITIQPEKTPVALEPKDEPKVFALEQNYPNPFNPTTTIKYSVAENGPVNLAVFNIMGQKVAELVSSTKQAGTYAISWQAQDMASGLYFYRLSAAGQTITRQMTLIK